MDFMVDLGKKPSPQSHGSPKKSQNLAFPRAWDLDWEGAQEISPCCCWWQPKIPRLSPPFWTVWDVSHITCGNFSWGVRKPTYQPRLLGFIAISWSLHFWQPINGWFGWVPGGAFIYIRENYAKRLQLISTLALGIVTVLRERISKRFPQQDQSLGLPVIPHRLTPVSHEIRPCIWGRNFHL